MTTGIIQALVRELDLMAEPLRAAAQHPEARRRLFANIGWNVLNVPEIQPAALITAIGDIITAIDTLVESHVDTEAELEQVGLGFDGLFAISDAVRTLQELAGSGAISPDPAQFAQLGRDLAEYLIVSHLLRHHTLLFQSMSVLTLIDPAHREESEYLVDAQGRVVRGSFPRPRLRLDRLAPLLSNPTEHLADFYFGNQPLITDADARAMSDRVFPRIAGMMQLLGAQAQYGIVHESRYPESDEGNRLANGVLTLVWDTPSGTNFGYSLAYSPQVRGDLGAVITPYGQLNLVFELTNWQLSTTITGTLVTFAIKRESARVLGDASTRFLFEARRRNPTGGPALLIGGAESTRLEFGGIGAAVHLDLAASGGTGSAGYGLELFAEDSRLVLQAGDGGDFLSAVLPSDPITVDFELGIGWRSSGGIFLRGGAALEYTASKRIELGPVKLDRLHVRIEPSASGIDAEASAGVTIALGPIDVIFERIGLLLELAFEDGNLGPLDAGVGFKLPNGIGLAIDLPPVKGGGFLFFDAENDEYAGVVQLAVADKFDIKAVGLVAQLPSGDFSLLTIGSVEFLPPIQLFAGFGLGGLGVLVGIHRAMDADALRAGVREGNLDSILFPQDPVRNAARIVNSLAKFFPPTQDTFVFGALGLVTWGAGGFFELKVGLALEVPHQLKLLVAAILNIALSPRRGEVLRLRADVLGFFEQGTGEVTIDGSLFDSQVAGFLVSGQSAFRNKSSKGFIMSAGGFHPAFEPPADLANMERLAISFSGGPFKIRVEGYFAITSNTIQAGAKAELRASAAGFRLEGWMSVDMLFQLDPFGVRIDFSAGVAIKRGSHKLMSLTLKASLDGFTPTRIAGRVSFSLLFITIKIPVSLTFGKKSERTFEKVDVLAQLLPAVREPRNWATDLDRADTQAVSLRQPDPAPEGKVLVHPLAPLSFRQQIVPLDTEIELFKSARPAGVKEFYINQVSVGGVSVTDDRRTPLSSAFAPAQYFEYTDDQKLSAPSFEDMPGGIRITTTELDFGDDESLRERTMQYETDVFDREEDEWSEAKRHARYTMELLLLFFLAALSSQGRQRRELRPGDYYPRGQKVALTPQRHVVAKSAGGQIVVADDIDGVTAEGTSHTQATVALRQHERENPGFQFRNPSYRVVGTHELAEAS